MSVPRDRGIVKSRMIEAVSQAGTDRDRGPIEVSAERVRDFVAHYLDHVPVTDLEQMDPDSLVQILESHFRLASRREPDTDLVQVTTPAGDDQWHLGESTLLQVVTDDRAFLVDSTAMEISRQGWSLQQVLHPQYLAVRSRDGQLTDLVHRRAEAPEAIRESWMTFVVYPPLGASAAELAGALESGVSEVLAEVRVANEDWKPMRAQMTSCIEQVEACAAPEQDRYAASDLLSWLLNDNFTLLGYRGYDLVDGRYQPQPGTGLGILRCDDEPAGAFQAVPRAGEPTRLVAFTKDNRRSRVHRGSRLDYVGIRVLDDSGQIIAERRFLGVLAAQAYDEVVTRIPALAAKTHSIIEQSGYAPGSHGAKVLLATVNKYPRDELFQASADELYPVIEGIAGMGERRQVRLFVHEDPWGRFASCLVYLPHDRFTTTVQLRLQEVLVRAFGGTGVDFQAQIGESALARLYFVIQLPTGTRAEIDLPALEQQLAEACQSWDDRFIHQVQGWPSEDRGVTFSEAYMEEFSPEQAVADLTVLNALAPDSIAVRLTQTDESDAADLRLRLYSWSRTALPQILPHLERLGVEVIDEWPYELRLRDQPAWLYEFGLRADRPLSQWPPQDRERFVAAFEASQAGWIEVDPLNALVTRAGLDWREVTWLRAMLRYLKQAGLPYSVDFMGAALVAQAGLAAQLVAAFRAAHQPGAGDPASQRAAANEQLIQIEQALDQVASLDHDRIIRALVALQRAVVRTNAFAEAEGAALAFKLLPRQLDLLPQPRPEFEIWVCSPRVEGVHLRFGQVARGGLRWSDRSEDFRTEVLGLAKAQMVKNTVIVPVGAKGGFVPRQLPDPTQDRAAWLEEGKAAYRIFITSLLSLTDSIGADGQVIPPAGVVRHDPDDPYLVVAADKGTATFSDLANDIALRRGFWLGDAFASGGSKGYDHKAMGITARGAWESVKRHFFEMGIDCQNQDFTCVGIGDMSGDVFGNGMLRSRHTRLVAAFDHRHIFIDPDPDPEVSFGERERLSRLPRSSWADYDPALISTGGGVYPRSAKTIPVTEPARQVLGLDPGVTTMTPNEYIHAILQAPVDLLWNGGIGTYVKGSAESHADAGDRANDAIRVDGNQVRARCAGEGGNLGWTQAGRIDYARGGGRINTDFIDNSAGVDTSDHEVNIKILLASLVAKGQITDEQRDQLLPQMTDEVAALVLAHNIDQNRALAMAGHGASRFAAIHEDWMRVLEADGYLDRGIEQMPSSAEMRRRIATGESLVGPELATLMSWTKIRLADIVLDSDLPDDPYLADRLIQYFPAQLRERFREAMPGHRLSREIITTVAVNRFVNSQGITAFHRLASDTGAAAADVIRAQLAARAMFRVGPLEVQLGRLPLPAARLTDLRIELRHMVDRGTRWALQTQPRPLNVQAIVDQYAQPTQQVVASLADVLTPEGMQVYERIKTGLEAQAVPQEIARTVAGAPFTPLIPTIVTIAETRGRDLLEVAADFFAVRERLGLYRFFDLAEALSRVDRWSLMAQAAVLDELLDVQARLADQVVAGAEPGAAAQQAVDRFVAAHVETSRVAGLLDQLATGSPDLGRLSVTVRMLRSLLAG